MGIKENRRSFVKKVMAAALGFIVAPAIPAFANGGVDLSTESSEVAGQLFEVAVRVNLFDPPKRVELLPGVMSDVINFNTSNAYRIMITPSDAKSAFGKVYTLVLSDVDGQKLDEMNVGSNTTATFRQFGVQVYVLAVQS